MSRAWPIVRLGELAAKVGSGATPKGGEATYTETGVPLIRSMNVVFFGFKREGLAYLDERQAAALKNVEVRPGDVLLNITGASIGRVTIAPSDMDGARVNQHVCIIRPADGIDSCYLRAFLSSPMMQDAIGAENYGVTRQALTKQQILDFQIPLAPLNEQKRIADKLDAILARVDACRERLDRVPAILKRLRQAVLAAATSGRLTEEWRAQQAKPITWDEIELGLLIADGPKNGLYKPSSAYGQGTRILRIDNFYDGAVANWHDLKRLNVSDQERADYGLEVGDIVINRVNSLPYLGKSALIRDLSEPCVFESNMIRIRLDVSRALSDYCILVLNSPAGISQLRKNAKHAVNQASINQSDVRSVVVPFPGVSEQREIVRRVEALFAYADRLEARYTAACIQVERLTPALLAKAFRGELVPQDPNDEPASVLLERIRASRVAAGEKPPRKVRTERKPMTTTLTTG